MIKKALDAKRVGYIKEKQRYQIRLHPREYEEEEGGGGGGGGEEEGVAGVREEEGG